MPRPAPWRLDPAAYPHIQSVQTRFQDLDVLGHINNVAFAALFETARVRFNREAELWGRDATGRRAVVAQVEVHYLAEGRYPGDVEVATGIVHVGGRSWSVLSAMFQDGRAVATCDAVIVADKDEDGEGLSEALKARFADWSVREG